MNAQTYEDPAPTTAGLGLVTREHHAGGGPAIDDLEPGDSTDLEGGLRLGYEKARESFRPGAVNVVVLCSDGVANVGATGPGSILETIGSEGRAGIHLTTVGYGMGNDNDHLMEQLADRANTLVDAEVPGAEEVATMVGLARAAGVPGAE